MQFSEFITRLRSDKVFVEKTVKDVTVNTTELFRDPKIWHTLRYRILPKLKENKTINIWHAGCSTGQEVYSMMILLSELDMLDKATIIATDINSDVLARAQEGKYKFRFNINYLDNFDKVIKENPYNYDEYREVPYDKYFDIDKVKDTLQMKSFLRDKPMFRKHDLVNGEMFQYVKFDIVLCRNVIIYFNNELQSRVFDRFHSSLYSGGYLVLGAHESILGHQSTRFKKRGMYYNSI
jgi:chemotaxis protein methyltransferase CheR